MVRSGIRWSGRLRNPEIRKRLESEADVTAQNAAAGGHVIWRVGPSIWETREATDMLDSALMKIVACAPPEPAKGAFIDSIRRCEPRAGG